MEQIYSPLQIQILTILQQKPMSRSELVARLKKPRTTIYDNLMGLLIANRIKKYSRPLNTRGRPIVFFKRMEE